MVTLFITIYFIYLTTVLFIGWRRARGAYLDALEEWECSEESDAD